MPARYKGRPAPAENEQSDEEDPDDGRVEIEISGDPAGGPVIMRRGASRHRPAHGWRRARGTGRARFRVSLSVQWSWVQT